MASMRDIKRRKSSIQSTQQITKAMKLVSTVKLQKAKKQGRTDESIFELYVPDRYFHACKIRWDRSSISEKNGTSTKKAIVVITSNRGLAGGYNSNLIKLVTGSDFSKDDVEIYAIGGKGREVLERRGYHIKEDDSYIIESPSYDDAAELCKKVLADYTNGTIGEIYLVYTHFKNTVVHEPKLMKLLPIEFDEEELGAAAEANVLMNYEPNETEALDMIIPKYVTSLFYGHL